MAGKSLEEKGTGVKLVQAFTRKLNGKLKIGNEKGSHITEDIYKYKKAWHTVMSLLPARKTARWKNT